MTVAQHRNKIGKFIIISNIIAFLLILFFFIFQGFTTDELTEVFKYLLPIKAVYMTALIRYIVSKKVVSDEEKDNDVVSNLYKITVNVVIVCHIVLLYTIITLCAFNIISFVTLTYGITIVETFFGVFIGVIISDMFQVTT